MEKNINIKIESLIGNLIIIGKVENTDQIEHEVKKALIRAIRSAEAEHDSKNIRIESLDYQGYTEDKP